MQNQIKETKLPQNVQLMIYSFLTIEELIKTISLLSKEQREFLVTQANLKQQRKININFKEENFFYLQSLRYLAQLCSSFDIYIFKFEMIDIFPFRMLV